jgi:hypothetical protein
VTRHRAINIAITAALAIGLAAILSTGHHLDDNSDEWAASQALADAQKAAQLAARTEKSAQALCQRIKGPNAAHKWTASGELICTSNKGQGAVSVAKVAL